jgi:hypothetical protein
LNNWNIFGNIILIYPYYFQAQKFLSNAPLFKIPLLSPLSKEEENKGGFSILND